MEKKKKKKKKGTTRASSFDYETSTQTHYAFNWVIRLITDESNEFSFSFTNLMCNVHLKGLKGIPNSFFHDE